jgi:formylglycine-generating enzyme required for sulfatase activity
MIWINAGTFTMGSDWLHLHPDHGEDDYIEGNWEGPKHQVTLTRGFYIGKYQVTQEQWEEVMGSENNPSYFDGSVGKEPAEGEVQGKRPVENVNWFDAIVFCNKLSIMEKLSPAYKINGSTDPDDWGNIPTHIYHHENTELWNSTIEIVANSKGYRLPTEAQWEYACRAGTTKDYSYGSDDPSATVGNIAWYYGNSGNKTHEVGKKSPNPWGLYDMHGNVWEWCWDWYSDYPETAVTDPSGPSSGTYRVYRGGSWGLSAVHARSSDRFHFEPTGISETVGFRLVRP